MGKVAFLKYARFRLFTFLLEPFSKMARKRRMSVFEATFKPTDGMKILDLGGQPDIWDSIKPVLSITCLNLPGIAKSDHFTHHEITYIEGDACNMPYFNKNEFDVIFSNSVIEHVGDSEKQRQFAREVQRLSENYWIQTPSIYFPIEAHCGMPFWWLYPTWLRNYFLLRWKKKLPVWAEMVETTTVITEKQLKDLFHDCKIKTEWLVFPKSIIAYAKA